MKQIRPSGRLVTILSVFTLLAVAAAFEPAILPAWKVAGALMAGLVFLDLYLCSRTPALEIKRQVQHSLPVAVWSKVGLEFKNTDARPLRITVYDHHPDHCDTDGLPMVLRLPPGQRMVTSYRLRPRIKGDMIFTAVDLLILSPMQCWWRNAAATNQDRVKVFPNFREIKKFTLLATDNRLSVIGIKKRQKRGEGNDFESLRDYRPGDTFRQIDWNKTSRYLKPITKEYQDERDQQVMFLLDCGRRMRHADADQTHFDQMLNAMLLLSCVAIRQQDAVGFLAFGGIHDWFPPQKNPRTINRMLNRVYTMEPTTEAADYLAAAKTIATLQKRRSLIILLTNSRDEDHEDLTAAMAVLRKRHLVVLADLREKILDTSLKQPVNDLDAAILFNAVYTYRETRRRHHAALRHQGVLALDILAEHLAPTLVNEYLMIKAAGRL
ncbi:MAG: DUF58 domain-containing protein [Thermodesulfobacteriota bacterium]|nr:DUF58 domain-containing protein [Thermodesulfobacteriota bacterium]